MGAPGLLMQPGANDFYEVEIAFEFSCGVNSSSEVLSHSFEFLQFLSIISI